MRRTGSTNYIIRKTIRTLKKYSRIHNAKIWRYVAELLETPSRKMIAINLSKINRYTDEGDTIVVPGKVLGAGNIDHKVTVAAVAFSQQAIAKIKSVGGRALHILEFLNENPKGRRIKVMR